MTAKTTKKRWLMGKRMTAETLLRDPAEDGGKVHIPNVGATGQHTLCGWTDTGHWESTTDPIDCGICLEIFHFIQRSSINERYRS